MLWHASHCTALSVIQSHFITKTAFCLAQCTMQTDDQIHYRSSTLFRPTPIIPSKASQCSTESFCTPQQILPLLPSNTKEMWEVLLVLHKAVEMYWMCSSSGQLDWLLIGHQQPPSCTVGCEGRVWFICWATLGQRWPAWRCSWCLDALGEVLQIVFEGLAARILQMKIN